MANSLEKSSNDLIRPMEDMFSKLPSLPEGIREFIVMVTPWLALVFGILGVLGTLTALGLLTAFSPVVVMGGLGSAAGVTIGVLLALASSVLLLAAFPGTKARKRTGWMFLFWSEIVSLVSSVVALSVGGVVFGLIGFYILFQIKSYYK